MTRIAPYVTAALALGLSACTNPYDPVQRGLGGGILGAFWCCHWSSGGWRAGSRPRSSDRWGNRDSRGSCDNPSTATGHLLRLPGLRVQLPCLWISRLSVPCLRASGLRAAGLWLPRTFGISRLSRSLRLWIPRRLRTSRRHRSSGLWIPRRFRASCLFRSPKLRILRRRGTPRLFWTPRRSISR